jgi:hypothetical protein
MTPGVGAIVAGVRYGELLGELVSPGAAGAQVRGRKKDA